MKFWTCENFPLYGIYYNNLYREKNDFEMPEIETWTGIEAIICHYIICHCSQGIYMRVEKR